MNAFGKEDFYNIESNQFGNLIPVRDSFFKKLKILLRYKIRSLKITILGFVWDVFLKAIIHVAVVISFQIFSLISSKIFSYLK